MEPKKVKKFTLNKETIANLTNAEMSHQKGGSWFFGCDTAVFDQITCVWSGVVMGACSAVTGCQDCLWTYGGDITVCGYACATEFTDCTCVK